MKKNTKFYLFIFSALVLSNIITYNFTYDSSEKEFYFTQIKLDTFMLKAYDRNDTSYMDISMNGGIDSIFHDAGKSEDYQKYQPLCQVFDKELFEIVQKYYEKNKKKYGVYKDPELINIRKNIEKGKEKMKELCNISK